MRVRVLLAIWLLIAATTTVAAWVLGGNGPGATIAVAWLASGMTLGVCLIAIASISRSRFVETAEARAEALHAVETAESELSVVEAARHESMLRRTGELAEVVGRLRVELTGTSAPAPGEDAHS